MILLLFENKQIVITRPFTNKLKLKEFEIYGYSLRLDDYKERLNKRLHYFICKIYNLSFCKEHKVFTENGTYAIEHIV